MTGKLTFQLLAQQLEKTSIESIIIGDSVIKPLESVRNLGSWFDAHMQMDVHIGKICSKAFCGLYNIRQVRKFLTVQSTKTLIHAFVSSNLDYCNALLFGVPKYQLDCLQKVQNATPRVTFQIVWFQKISIPPHRRDLLYDPPSPLDFPKSAFKIYPPSPP